MLLFTYWLYCLTINQLEMVSANKYNHCNYSFYYTKRPDQGVDDLVIKAGFDFLGSRRGLTDLAWQ